MALTREKFQELLDAGGFEILLEYINTSAGIDAQTAMNAKSESHLLWTNPNPGSNFADGSQSLSLTGYDAIDVAFRANISNSNIFGVIRCNVGTSCTANCVGSKIYRRDISVTTSGITWGQGQEVNTYGGAATNNNADLIPVRIYGVKYSH